MNLVKHGEAHWKKRSMVQIEVSYNLEEITWAKVNEMNYYFKCKNQGQFSYIEKMFVL